MKYQSFPLSILTVALLIVSCSPFDDGFVDGGYDDAFKPGKPVTEQTQQPDPEPDPEPEPEELYVPVVKVVVENNAEIDSKDEYKNAEITISKGYEVILSASGRIKGRGNATWGYDKKPYKIKFDEKQGFWGLAPNKDWVLLAEYCDKSLMRTPYMCELAQTAGLPYPIHYRHVQLYVNGDYMGMYILADQVEKKKNRVDIEDDGFLFENDNYFWNEPLHFMTDYREYWYTFKYPDPEDGEIVSGDASFNFITGFMNDFESALYGDDFKNPETGYRKYIDVPTFAKWFLVQELTANLEPNMYYVLPSRDAKLQIGPVWDAEWSMGLAYRADEYSGWESLPAEPDRYQQIWSKWKYFGRLFEDEYFVDAVRQEWESLQLKLPAFKEKMAEVADNIKEEQKKNYEKWNTLGWNVSVGLIRFDTWEEEVQYVTDFFNDRVEWLDNLLDTL